MQQGPDVINPTPTGISLTVARCAYFMLDTAITVNNIRWYGVGATTGIYRVAVYRNSDSVRMAVLNDFNTTANAWNNGAFVCTLAANVLYFVAVAIDTTGTTAGIRAMTPTFIAATSLINLIPTSWPGNLAVTASKVPPFAFCQFAVTAGALPATAPSRVVQAAWTGGMPAFFLDNNSV